LGLVFIFIIAFVINGLPRFRSAVNRVDATPIMSVGDESIGIASKEHKAQDTIESVRFQGGQVDEQQTASHSSDNTAESNDNSTLSSEGTRQGSIESTASDNPASLLPQSFYFPERTRFQMSFSGNPFMADSNWRSSVSTSDNVNKRGTEKTVPPVAPSGREPQVPQTQTRTDTPQAQAAQGMIYVVQDGDNLAKIAKKFYGQDEGNKRANINLIVEANRDVIKSVDDVLRSGKKIVIPSLPPSTPTAADNRPAIFQNPQFVRVGTVGGVPDTGRWYTVKDSDKLWTISAEQLGKGSRYTEIIKLNTDKLSEDNNYKLLPGMQLRLPAN
jgi:nucleoid-associated protein YgaU